MIISAVDIENTPDLSTASTSASTSQDHHSNHPKRNNNNNVFLYNLCKKLRKLSHSKNSISWECFLTEVLGLNNELGHLPSDILLIGKLDDPKLKRYDKYNLIKTESDYDALIKLAKKKKCSLSIIIKYTNRHSLTKVEKIIDDLLKPNSLYLSVCVCTESSHNSSERLCKNEEPVSQLAKSSGINLAQEMNPAREVFAMNVIKNFVNIFQENMVNLETYINSVLVNKHMDKLHVGYVCDHCRCNIMGVRYRCSICADFDLCEMCESVSERFHSESHHFLKIKKPLEVPQNKNSVISTNDSKQDVSLSINSSSSDSISTKQHNENIANVIPDVSTPEKATVSTDTSKQMAPKTNIKGVENKNENNKINVQKVKRKKGKKPVNGNDKQVTKTTAASKEDRHQERPHKQVEANPGSILIKKWKIRNMGTSKWTSIIVRNVAGNVPPVGGQHTLTVPELAPGQERTITISFQVPKYVAPKTILFSEWRFYLNGRPVSKTLRLSVLVQSNTGSDGKVSTVSFSKFKTQKQTFEWPHDKTTLVENVPVQYPACFDLTVPFPAFKTSNCEAENRAIIEKLYTEARNSLYRVHIDRDWYTSPRLTMSPKPAPKVTIVSEFQKKETPLNENENMQQNQTKLALTPQTIDQGKLEDSPFFTKSAINSSPACVTTDLPPPKHNGDVYYDPAQSSIHLNNIEKRLYDQYWERNNKQYSNTSFNNNSNDAIHYKDEQKNSSSSTQQSIVPEEARTIIEESQFVANSISDSPDYSTNSLKPPNSSTVSMGTQFERMNTTLCKLFEMGFCNETLNQELLVKNNYDIARTVQELLNSTGNCQTQLE